MATDGAPTGNSIQLQNRGNQLDLVQHAADSVENTNYSTHMMHQIKMETIETRLEDIIDTASGEVKTNCAMMTLWNETCRNNASTCQLANFGIQSAKNAITILPEVISSIANMCELSEFITECDISKKWAETNSIHDFHENISRKKRFLASWPITINIATGLLLNKDTAASSFKITKGDRTNPWKDSDTSSTAITISPEDTLESLSTRTTANFHYAEALKHKIDFRLNRNSQLSLKDPEAETWFRIIKETVVRNAENLTESRIREAARLTANLTTVTTSLIPLKENVSRCEAMALLHTIVIPTINFNSKKTFTSHKWRLHRNPRNSNRYTLLSEESVLSMPTTLFGQKIQIIGRTCEIVGTINSSTFPSGNLLIEKFKFVFKGKITITETCHVNGKKISATNSLRSEAIITLPILHNTN